MITIDTRKLFYKINNALRENQRLMKLLYFDVPSALNMPDLIDDDKIDEIFYGKEIKNDDGTITTNKRIFNEMSNPDILNFMSSQIRYYPHFTQENNLTKVTLFFEIIVNNNLEQLDDFFSRSIEITKEVQNSLKKCNAIGKLEVNGNTIKKVFFGKSYYGYMFVCTTRLNSKWGE